MIQMLIHDSVLIHGVNQTISYINHIDIYMIHYIYISSRARDESKVNQEILDINKMKKISWKDKKNEICNLIKQVSDYYGEDDVEWLRDYAKEIIADNKHDIDTVLSCFKNLWNQCKMIKY